MPEARSLVVDTDENLGDVLLRGFLILCCRGLTDVDGRKPIVGDCMRAIDVALHGVLVFFVDRAALVPKRVHEVTPDLWLEARPVPEFGHIRQELRIIADRRVGNLETPVTRPKRDRDLSRCTVFADDFDTANHGVERRETLLAIDDESSSSETWSFRSESTSVFVVGCVPEDKCPHREAYEERVEEFAYLCIFPDEGPLQVWQRDHLTLDVTH